MSKYTVQSLACAGLATLLLMASSSNAAVEAHTHAAPATKTASSQAAKPKTTLKMTPDETVIHVGDLHCVHCAKRIASKLYAVKGVMKVRTDLKADVAIVTPQSKKKLDPLALWKAANTSGFPAVKLEGPTGTYVLDPKTKTAQLVPAKATKTAAPKS